MKIYGEATVHAPRQRVWDALQDPAVLVRTIPGCERLELTGPDEYAMTVTAGVASIKGTYSGRVALSEQDVPNALRLTAAGSGGPGTVNTEVQVTLEDAGEDTTRIRYDADAVIGGMVAGVGQRMLVAVAKKTAGEFFAAVNEVVTGAAPPSAAESDDVAASTAAAQRPRVFTAPPKASTAATGGRWFMAGALFGAGIALAGVLIGAVLGRRR